MSLLTMLIFTDLHVYLYVFIGFVGRCYGFVVIESDMYFNDDIVAIFAILC